MSLKIHFLHSYMDFFRDNFGAVSNEHKKRFTQDILQMEKYYKRRCEKYMMSDECWFLQREDPAKHNRKK